ncbi:hypothetical protein L7F22_064941 [Adiantum nelumboides]|nr:hypothetical protein [Adiantum nelumboides]
MVFGVENALDKIGDEMNTVLFYGILLLDNTLLLHRHLSPLSQVDKDYALFVMVITGGMNAQSVPILQLLDGKRPNPSTTRRNTNMESCSETEQCSTSHSDKGKQAVRAVRVSKVVSVLMLNDNTHVSVPINLSNQVLSLLGFVSKHPLIVLVDSGCSTNFVSTTLLSKLRLPTQQSVEAFQVELADGSYLQCNKKSWLYQYDPIINFRDHSIRLYHNNQELKLRGLFNTEPITMKMTQKIISGNGIAVDPKKIQVIMDWPLPLTISDVRSFLGLANFYHTKVHKILDIAAPLTELTKRDKLQWSSEAEKSLNDLKQALTTTLGLAIADLTKPLDVMTDASDRASRGVFMQNDRVIAFDSHKVSTIQMQYPVYDKEFLAIVHAYQTWKHYLLGADSVVRTDHQSLTYIFTQLVMNPRQGRWIEFLANFHMVIQYVRGLQNAVADALSRMPKATNSAIYDVQMEIPACFKNEYLRDKDFGDAFRALKSLNPTPAEMNMFASYTMMDELLYYLDRICVPHNRALWKILIQEHHEFSLSSTNGWSDRKINQILEEMLRHYIQIRLASWEEYLPLVEFAYDNAPHSVTGMTPFQAAYGHTPLVPTNFVLQHKVALADQLVQEMQDILVQVRDKLVHVQQKYQKQANKHRRHAEFNEGDLVLLYVAFHRYKTVKSVFPKLRPRFYGPFKIIKKNSVVSYKLELPPSWEKLHRTIHNSWLKQYIQGDSPVPELSSYVPEIEDENVILVPEMILDVRQKETRRKLTTEFLVKWMDSDSTWQTDEEMQQYPNLLQEFFNKRQIFL